MPILNSTAAISRSMALLPSFIWADSHAVLVERTHLGVDLFGETPEEADWLPDAPIWLVGLLADPSTPLTVEDTISPSGLPVNDPTPVDGVFFIFDANHGSLASSGGISTRSGALTWDMLVSLTPDALTIQHATAVPTPAVLGLSIAPSEPRLGQSGPTPTLPAWAPAERYSTWSRPLQPVADWISTSDFIAEVKVETIQEPIFNTESGALPTEAPTGESNHGLLMGSPVALKIVHAYRGSVPGVTGVVVWQNGGTYYDFEDRWEPPFIFMSDSRGVLFGTLITFNEQAGNHQGNAMLQLAASLSSSGAEYRLAWFDAFYEYDGQTVVSAIDGTPVLDHWLPSVMPIDEFSSALEAGFPSNELSPALGR